VHKKEGKGAQEQGCTRRVQGLGMLVYDLCGDGHGSFSTTPVSGWVGFRKGGFFGGFPFKGFRSNPKPIPFRKGGKPGDEVYDRVNPIVSKDGFPTRRRVMERDEEDAPAREDFEPVVFEAEQDECRNGSFENRTKDGAEMLKWMVEPCSLEEFMEECWDQKPLLVKRNLHPDYYQKVFGMEEVDRLLRQVGLTYGLNIDVTSYKDGKRHHFNSNRDGSTENADPDLVWKRFHDGASLRILHPQRWTNAVWKLLSGLEGYWSCGVGSNVYLTPPGSQGFAPHYDDIDAFILQIEGKKQWKVYTPPTSWEVLARESSEDYDESELDDPLFEVELTPGDLLYLPRGVVHQAHCLEDTHSLHLTVSCNQHNTFADLLELALPRALEITIEEEVECRRSLPPGYLDYMGVVHADNAEHPARQMFLERVENLVRRVMENLPVDAAADQLGSRFIRQRLPIAKPQLKAGGARLGPHSRVKLVEKDVARMIVEEDVALVVHALNNSRTDHMEGGEEPLEDQGSIEFSLDDAMVIEQLLAAFPEAVSLQAIEADGSDAVRVANTLVNSGVLVPIT